MGKTGKRKSGVAEFMSPDNIQKTLSDVRVMLLPALPDRPKARRKK